MIVNATTAKSSSKKSLNGAAPHAGEKIHGARSDARSRFNAARADYLKEVRP